jgi:hypothetical protein
MMNEPASDHLPRIYNKPRAARSAFTALGLNGGKAKLTALGLEAASGGAFGWSARE